MVSHARGSEPSGVAAISRGLESSSAAGSSADLSRGQGVWLERSLRLSSDPGAVGEGIDELVGWSQRSPSRAGCLRGAELLRNDGGRSDFHRITYHPWLFPPDEERTRNEDLRSQDERIDTETVRINIKGST